MSAGKYKILKNDSVVLDKLVALAQLNDDIDVIWLYGSQALGTALEHSDIDIAIAFKNCKLSVLDKFLRPNELALEWHCILGISESKLSLVDINLIPIYLAYNVVSDGRVIFQTPTARACIEYNRILSQYEYCLVENRKNEE